MSALSLTEDADARIFSKLGMSESAWQEYVRMRDKIREDLPQPNRHMLWLIEIKTKGKVSFQEQLVFGTNNEAF